MVEQIQQKKPKKIEESDESDESSSGTESEDEEKPRPINEEPVLKFNLYGASSTRPLLDRLFE